MCRTRGGGGGCLFFFFFLVSLWSGGLDTWVPSDGGGGFPHTSSECIYDACDPLPPKGHPVSLILCYPPNPSPGAAGEGNWACGNQGLRRGGSLLWICHAHRLTNSC